MARLPDPVTEKIDAIWSEDRPLREKSFYSIIGQGIRKGVAAERESEEVKEE